jgi:hypothetical protein
MTELHRIWIEQCDAARVIEDEYGLNKALGYLIGEKFMKFVRVADQDPLFAGELPLFAEEIKRIFDQHEIREYLDSARRLGPLGHILDDDEHDDWVSEGVIEENPASWVEDVLVLERVKELLIE